MKVYKFYRVNQYLLNSLRDKTTWYSKLDHLNDPFECFFIDNTGSDVYKKMVSTFCVCCYSESYDHILMWSHYADNHKGVCLEWEVDNQTIRTTFFRMDYTNSLKELNEVRTHKTHGENFGKLDLNITNNGKFIRSKFDMWKHERELRTIVIEEDPNVMGVNKPFFGDLKSIFYGVRCPKTDIQKVKTASEHMAGIQHKHVVLDQSSMKIKIGSEIK